MPISADRDNLLHVLLDDFAIILAVSSIPVAHRLRLIQLAFSNYVVSRFGGVDNFKFESSVIT